MKSASYLRTKKQITEDLVQKIQDAETLTVFLLCNHRNLGKPVNTVNIQGSSFC